MKPIFIFLLLAAAPLHAQSPVLGKIGDIEIKTEEIREALAGLEAGQESALSKDPAAINQYVRALLVQRLVLKEALDQKFDQNPAVIAKLVRAREAALTEAYLDSFSQPPKDYPTEAEISTAYESAKTSLLLPKTFRLAQIFVKEQAKSEEIAKKLKAKDANFGTIARTASEEKTSAAKDGEIGWLAENQIQPEIRERLPKLTAGTVSEAIKLTDGWHFIKILETREPTTATLDQVRPQLITKLRAERTRQNRQQHLAELLQKYPLAINEIELGKILSR